MATAFVVALAGAAQATTWNVPGDGSGTCTTVSPNCDTIADAITASSDNDDIQVAAGTYAETALHVNKDITINGAGPASTFVEPSGIGFFIDTDGVILSNLTVRNGTDGIRFELAGQTIDDTELNSVHLVSNTSDGVELSGATTVTNLDVIDSTFQGNNNGIRMASTSTVNGISVTGSTFQSNASVGLYQANDGGTSTLANLTVTDTTFDANAFTGLYAEEIRDSSITGNTFSGNGRGILIFKGYTTSGATVGNVTINENDFTGGANASVQLVIQASGLTDDGITVEGNTFTQNVGLLVANWGLVDVRLMSTFTNAPVDVTSNTFDLSGTFGVATAAYGVMVRGNGPVDVSSNIIDGGGITGTGTPASSGVYIRSNDATFGQIPATATISGTCNRITGFVNGISIYDAVNAAFGGLAVGTTVSFEDSLIAGNSNAGVVNGASPPAIDAEDNYWGCAAGPGNPGCDGVVGNVDFTPFATSTPSCVACTQNSDCEDGNACTQDSCDMGQCVNSAEPVDPGSCFTAQKAQLTIKLNANPTKNNLKWKWIKGEAFDQLATGTPNVDTQYTLCVYDTSAGVPDAATSLSLAIGSPPWINKAPKGWKYTDKTTAADGVKTALVVAGTAGKTKAQVVAKGVNLPAPAPFSGTEMFDQNPNVIVQLVNSEGSCWTSAFVPASTKRNTSTQFSAKAP